MHRIKLMITSLIVVFAFSAIAVQSASALWYVAGNELATGSKEALAAKTKVEGSLVLSIATAKIKIGCTSLTNEKAEIIGTNTIEAKELILGGCSVTEGPAKCAIEKTEIHTTSIKGTVTEGTEPDDKISIKPSAGKNFAEIKFNESCTGFAGVKVVSGTLNVDAPTLQNELVEQPLKGEGKASELTIGGVAVEVTGTASLKLVSEKKWQNRVQPHWYSEGSRLPSGGVLEGLAVKTGTGTGKIKFTLSGGGNRECKMEDAGVIWNPNGNGPGKIVITAVTFPAATCTSTTCLVTPELVAPAAGLPWNATLDPGTPILLSITNMQLETRCNGVGGGALNGAGIVAMLNGEGAGEAACTATEHTTWSEFTNVNNSFTGGGETGNIVGRDCIWGETNEKIKVRTP